jgi:hypothetical protein
MCYNSDMNSITIRGVDLALAAGEWANENIGATWNLDLGLMGDNPVYTFKFDNAQDAAFFALKWLQ